MNKIKVLSLLIFTGLFGLALSVSAAVGESTVRQTVYNSDFDPETDDQFSLSTEDINGSFVADVMEASGVLSSFDDTHIDDTNSVVFNYDMVLTVPDGSGGGFTLNISAGTTMTTAAGEEVDFSALLLNFLGTVTLNNVEGDTLGGLKFGLGDYDLNLSAPISLSMNVGSGYNGEVLDVYHKRATGNDWSDLTDCTVSGGVCTFTTTTLSEFATVSTGQLSAEAQGAINARSGGFSESQLKQRRDLRVAGFKAVNLTLEVAKTGSTVVSWETTLPALSEVSWGKTKNYELGAVKESLFLENHSISLDGLDAGDTYYVRIIAKDPFGIEKVLEEKEFVAGFVTEELLLNIGNLNLTEQYGAIGLTWENPAGFESVRVMRSEEFYPQDHLEGFVMYEGRGESMIDENIVEDKTYYYTIFVEYPGEKYSSGAVVAVYVPKKDVEDKIKPVIVKIDEIKGVSLTDLPDDKDYDVLRDVELSDFIFSQNNKRAKVEGDIVSIESGKSTGVLFRHDEADKLVKTIIINLRGLDDSEKGSIFFLKPDDDRKTYNTLLDPYILEGNYDFTLFIFGHGNELVNKIDGRFDVKEEVKDVGLLSSVLRFTPLFIVLFVMFVFAKFVLGKQEAGIRE